MIVLHTVTLLLAYHSELLLRAQVYCLFQVERYEHILLLCHVSANILDGIVCSLWRINADACALEPEQIRFERHEELVVMECIQVGGLELLRPQWTPSTPVTFPLAILCCTLSVGHLQQSYSFLIQCEFNQVKYWIRMLWKDSHDEFLVFELSPGAAVSN